MMNIDDLADVRTGDKGDTLIVAVRARSSSDYPVLEQWVTEAFLEEAFSSLLTGRVARRTLPQIAAMVFEAPGVLGAGVTGSPTLDGHGKTMSYYVASLPLPAEVTRTATTPPPVARESDRA